MKYENLIERLDFTEFEQLFKIKMDKSKSKKPKKSKCEEKEISTAVYNEVSLSCCQW